MSAPARSRLCPEFQAVVAATVWPATAESLAHLHDRLAQPLDWPHLLSVARRQRVVGLVHTSVCQVPGDIVPAEVRAHLVKHASDLALRNLAFVQEMQRLIAELRRSGIPVAVLKGAPLGMLAYGSLGVRHSKDLDLLVSPHQTAEADRILRECGYRRTAPPEAWPESELAAFCELRSHFEYARPGTSFEVELHWRLSENIHFGIPLPDPDTWREVDLGGGLSAATLAPGHLVEYLCMHGAAHAWSRLKWLADVGALINKQSEIVDALMLDAARHGTLRAVEQALSLHARLYDLSPVNRGRSGVCGHLLSRMAEHVMTGGCAAAELSGDRLRNAEVHASHFLLNFRPQYLRTELRNEVLLPPAWSQSAPRPSRRALQWVRGVWVGLRRVLLPASPPR